MTREKAEVYPFPAERGLQNANRNAYHSMKSQRILQPSRTLARAMSHLQGAAEVLDSLLLLEQDRMPPAMAADLNEAVALVFEALQRVGDAGAGALPPEGEGMGLFPQSAANLR